MSDHDRNQQIEAVKGWWNIERNKKKWEKAYDDNNIHAINYLKKRQKSVLRFVDSIGLPEGAQVIELGYGAGQTALALGKRGFNIHGVDISEKLCLSATQRCLTGCPEGKFNLKVGNIEGKFDYDNETFDLAVIIGALQYLYSPGSCLREVYRTLKPGGHFILSQRNIYSLSNMTSTRQFFRSCVHFLLREEFELFPSYRSILVDSGLGRFFKRYEQTPFFNSEFMLKGHDFWKFKIKKRINSYFSLRSLLDKEGFTVLNTDGAYYCFSENPRFYEFNLKLDKIIENLLKKHALFWLFILGRSVIFLCRKRGKII